VIPEVRPRVLQVERRPAEVRTPGSRYTGVRTVAVARLDRLGDVVLSLPALAALRAGYPGARLAVLVRESLVPLIRMVEGVDDAIGVGPGAGRLAARLGAIEPDLLVCISRGPAPAWAGVRARVRHRVGAGHRFYSVLFERRVDEHRRGGGRHEVEYALSFAHRAGAAAGPERFGIVVPDGAERSTADWLQSRGLGRAGFVVLHPGSGGSCPSWPAESWARLVTLLRDAGRQAVISLGPGDAATGAAFDAAAGAAREAPRFSAGLAELAALARRAATFAGNNTGPLHLAAAVGAPVLGLYAPWATCGASRWGPYSGNGWALVADSAAGSRWTRRRRRRDGSALLAAVTPETVAGCLLDLAAGRPVRVG